MPPGEQRKNDDGDKRFFHHGAIVSFSDWVIARTRYVV